MNAPATAITIDISKRVAQYVQMRDKIKSLDDEHKSKMKPFRETLEKLNGLLLEHLNSIGGDSVKTESGTVYRSEKKSASLEDPDAFMTHVVENELWDLMDRKANVTAVVDYIAEHNAPPPGVNFSTRFEVGVRRK